MFRTRNYAVVTGLFGLVAMASAAVYSFPAVFLQSQVAGVAFVDSPEANHTATISADESISREDRIAQLRKKIASRKIDTVAVVDSQAVATDTEEEATPVIVSEEEKAEIRCSNYRPSTVVWSSAGVITTEVEGARLVYKEGTPTVVGSTSIPTRNVLAQLPLRSAPTSVGNCIASDVIGISVKGSLIRNNEVLAYGNSGPAGLVGYALDGFPIYGGTSAGATDVCGGATVAGQYRYFVSSAQKTIINCYSGTPISL
jgi:hypothetical protein